MDSITIEEFRGIRHLTLDFKQKNFAICGPNGTGKSGVVDALEFALTGNVSRLSGEGRGEISLKQHGPHVDRRNDPGKARITVKATIPSLSKTVTIERSLKTPAVAQVTPSDPAVLDVLRRVEAHPEIVLSRRELIRYVLATPGKRADEVRALLHLDQVEQVRKGLQKIANDCERKLAPLDREVSDAREKLLRALDLSELTKEKLLIAVNIQRAILGLSAFTDLTETTSLKDGMATPGPVQPQRIPKAQAVADIRAAREVFSEISSDQIVTQISETKSDLSALVSDPAIATNVKRETFYTTGLELIEEDLCPFCDNTWNLEELKRHVQLKLDHLGEVSRKRTAAEVKIAPIIEILGKVRTTLSTLAGYAALATPPLNFGTIREYITSCEAAIQQLTAFLPLTETITALAHVPLVPEGVLTTLSNLETVVAALPEPTKQDAAKEWLTVGQERLEVWRNAARKLRTAKEQSVKARQVFDIYSTTSDGVLSGLYAAVEKDFSSLYGFINRRDEDKFQAQLAPSMGKLGFNVDFYGRGFFPPGAYHSEGHQDSMGLCLYLALMRYLQGNGFTFAVLDDVLMSVDAAHRRDVCALLKREFPDTQFVMTTHDPIWLRHMRTEGLIGARSGVQFKGWSVDHGPTRWDDWDVWTEINDYLTKNDVRAAAAILRHYLEYTSAELCDRLRASVEFHGDAQFQLGELLPAAIKQMRDLYRRGKDAANSWGQRDIIEALTIRESAFIALAETSRVEQWQVNTAIHYNAWDNLSKEDFEPVVKTFRDLLGGFTCSNCNEYFRVLPEREKTPEFVRCGCGNSNFNLLRKSG